MLNNKTSNFGNSALEGIYLRIDSNDFLKERAKLVSEEFVQSIVQHWSKGILRKNTLVSGEFFSE